MGNTAPKTLGRDGKELWLRLQPEYGIEDAGGLALLRTACELLDLEREAMKQARADGLSSVDRYGQRRPHPLLAVARDARAQMLAALRSLNLDVMPKHERPGRPVR